VRMFGRQFDEDNLGGSFVRIFGRQFCEKFWEVIL